MRSKYSDSGIATLNVSERNIESSCSTLFFEAMIYESYWSIFRYFEIHIKIRRAGTLTDRRRFTDEIRKKKKKKKRTKSVWENDHPGTSELCNSGADLKLLAILENENDKQLPGGESVPSRRCFKMETITIRLLQDPTSFISAFHQMTKFLDSGGRAG